MIPRLWVVLLLLQPLFAAVPRGCTGSLSLGSFRLWVRPSSEGVALPLKSVAAVPESAHLIWEPLRLSSDASGGAEVAGVILPVGDGGMIMLEPRKAAERAEWAVERPPAVVALVYGPHGLSAGKVKAFVNRNQELISQLANYAEQTSEVEALVQHLADSEASGGGATAALKGFSSLYGVQVPKLDPKASTDEQAVTLLRALLPSASSYDPVASRTAQMQQSGGLAASVAAMFFGTPVGLAAGGAALLENLGAAMFPGTEFRSAFAQSAAGDGMALCTKAAGSKSRTRLAYLWAYRVPGWKAPAVKLAGVEHLPIGSKSPVKLAVSDPAVVKQLERARDWQLVPLAGGDPVKVPVAIGTASDTLEIDLSKLKAPAGRYHLAATWDWEPLAIEGTLETHPYADFGKVQFAPGSRDKLVEGSGTARVTLTGTDFEFVEKAAVEKSGARQPQPAEIHFTLPAGRGGGKQESMEVEIDTATRGAYRLLITQSDGLTHEVPFTILPPNPRISNLPLRVNLGEQRQAIKLEGSGLDRVEGIASDTGEITGAPAQQTWTGEIRLKAGAAKGQRLPLNLRVRGLENALDVPNAIEVVGPRPKIASVQASAPVAPGIEIREGELPVGTAAGFALRVENLHEGGAPATVQLGCEGGDVRTPLILAVNQRAGGASLTVAGADILYLSVDPGQVGSPGCRLTATVTTDPEGRSDARVLGTLIRVPKLEKLELTNEKLGDSGYAGTLSGRDLDVIAEVGWDAQHGLPVESIPTPVPDDSGRQTLRVALPWPAPAPHAPLYVWVRGEAEGRRTAMTY